MTLNANAVRVAGTGEVYLAPAGTAAPTDASTPLPPAWKGLGITSTDGVQFTMSRDTSDIDGWQQSKIRVVTNSEPVTVEMTLIETNADTLTAAFGGGTVVETGADSGEYKFTPPEEGSNAIRALCVEFRDGNITYRYFFGRTQVEGDVSFSLTRSDAVGYSTTFGVLSGTPKWELFSNDPELDPGIVVLDETEPELAEV